MDDAAPRSAAAGLLPAAPGRAGAPRAASRWPPVVAGMLLQICGGSIYITSLYTTDLRTRFFGHDQHAQANIQQLVFASNLGNWLPCAGFFLDSRFGGGRNTALVASVLTLLGYLGVYAWSTGVVELAYWQVWFCWFLWGHGSGWFDNAAISTTARNFPLQRGRAMALMKAFYGLSGSLLTQAFYLFFGRTSPFLLFLSLFLSALGATASCWLWLVPLEQHGERDEPVRRLDSGLKIVLGLALFLLLVNFAHAWLGAVFALSLASFLVMLLLLAILLLVVAGPLRGRADPAESARDAAAAGPAREPPLVPSPLMADGLGSAEFWLLFLIVFVGMGSGLVVVNNIGQMAVALGGETNLGDVLVSLVSVASCLGRVAYGVAPDALSGTLARPGFLALNLSVMMCAMLLLSTGSMPGLVAGAVVAGFCYGGFWTLMPSLISEFFGTEHFATLYNCQSLAVSSASFVFSTELAARVYDGQAAAHPGSSAGSCWGPTCFRATSVVMAACCALGLGFSAALLQRRRWRRSMRGSTPGNRLG